MLRRCVIVSFIVALVATCLPVLTEESLELVNSGFEQTEEETVGEPSLDWEQTGAPPGWSAWFGSTARASNAEMVWTAGVAHSDSRSASVRSSDGPTVIMLTGGGGGQGPGDSRDTHRVSYDGLGDEHLCLRKAMNPSVDL